MWKCTCSQSNQSNVLASRYSGLHSTGNTALKYGGGICVDGASTPEHLMYASIKKWTLTFLTTVIHLCIWQETQHQYPVV